uniref:Transmembrane p24 trafficking protein 6 n=1 Tax=Haplochromis burtoni TaxID=8153 RepID=A0A3Q2V856_HAPBU
MSGSVCGSFKVHLFGSPGEFPSCRVFLSISSASICAARPVFPAEEETFQGWLIIFDLTAAQTLLSPFHVLDMLCWIPCFFLGFLFWGSAHGVPQTNARPDVTDQELFWGSDQYDFAIVLPAAGLECFWHFAHRGERFYLNFMVQWVMGVGHDRHLSVTVNTPSDLLLSTVDDAKGQINFEAAESGFYQMCFSNFHNRFGSMQISLSFGVYYDTYQDPSKSEEEEKKKKEEISKELNNTLSVIEVHIATCCYSCYSVVVSVAVLTAVGEPKQVKCI